MNFLIKLLCLIFFVVSHNNGLELHKKYVKIAPRAGSVLGSVEISRHGNTYHAFRGIPYAESPEGELRWKPPVPKAIWEGIFNASEDGPECYQIEVFPTNRTRTMSEDCLHLSVFYKPTGQLKPVMVNIHGGAFFIGSNLIDNYSPAYIIDYDVVFVSINYRLGPFGFLNSGTAKAPGNFGLKDQVLALKWIQQNIIAFEGDPNHVTLIGHSAGSISAVFHMLSPMSSNLFRAVIAMSGAPTNQLGYAYDNVDIIRRVADLVECGSDDPIDDIVECLRYITADKLINTGYYLAEFENFCPIAVFTPTLEHDFGQEIFINRTPEEIILSGNFSKVPILTGLTKDEFAFEAFAVLNDDNIREQFNNNFEHVAPICLLYERDTERSRNISNILRNSFIPNPLQNDDYSLVDLQKLYGDSLISFGNHRFVQLIWEQVNVFYYKVTYIGRFSNFYHPENVPWGVEHGDCIMYVLENRGVMPEILLTDPEHVTIERMTRMWTNFAYTGNPNNPDDEYIGNLNWIPYNGIDHNYLDIGDELVMKKRLFLERFEIWDELFPINIPLTYKN